MKSKWKQANVDGRRQESRHLTYSAREVLSSVMSRSTTSKSCPRSLWDWWSQCLWKWTWRCKWGECQKNYSSCNWNAALSFLVENWAQFSYKEEEEAGVDGETGVALGTASGVDTPLKRTLRESWSRPKYQPLSLSLRSAPGSSQA